MRASFDIAVSQVLTADQFAASIQRLVPVGLEIDVSTSIPSNPDADIAATIESTKDRCWPCTFCCWWHSAGVDNLGPYPDLRLATEWWTCYGVDSLCDTYPFAGDFAQHDPYEWLACVKGQWYLADAVDVQPVTGEKSDSRIKLIRPIDIPKFCHL